MYFPTTNNVKMPLHSPKHTKKRSGGVSVEERVALIESKNVSTTTTTNDARKKAVVVPSWPLSRLLRYMAMCVLAAIVTFFSLRRQHKMVRWEEYHHLLVPDKKEPSCYNDGFDIRCSCPNPTKPTKPTLNVTEAPAWMKHHEHLIEDAKNAPNPLDVVFIGDSITERWNGTRRWGMETENSTSMRNVFQELFTKKGGSTMDGLALGAARDMAPNLLWHLDNGILKTLRPKVWFILIGSNDMFLGQCTDRFVLAGILNVLRKIYMEQPDAQFIVHGILPRMDPFKAITRGKINVAKHQSSVAARSASPLLSQHLGRYWKRSQAVNAKLKQFCENHENIQYMQAGSAFLKESGMRGRQEIDVELMDDGIHPTAKGLKVWGEKILEVVNKTLVEKDLI